MRVGGHALLHLPRLHPLDSSCRNSFFCRNSADRSASPLGGGEPIQPLRLSGNQVDQSANPTSPILGSQPGWGDWRVRGRRCGRLEPQRGVDELKTAWSALLQPKFASSQERTLQRAPLYPRVHRAYWSFPVLPHRILFDFAPRPGLFCLGSAHHSR